MQDVRDGTVRNHGMHRFLQPSMRWMSKWTVPESKPAERMRALQDVRGGAVRDHSLLRDDRSRVLHVHVLRDGTVRIFGVHLFVQSRVHALHDLRFGQVPNFGMHRSL